MWSQKITENWKMRAVGEDTYVTATVPGSVYNDLLEHGKMEDPYYRDNENKALLLMDNDYEYQTLFDTTMEMLKMDEIVLRFDGIDTLADIWLNGVHLGAVNNMHRIWEYSVKKLLKKEANSIKVLLHSPTKFVEKAHQTREINGTPDAMRGFPQIRKAHCMFGWDWGPRLPDAGIWKDVTLIGSKYAKIDSVYIAQVHKNEEVVLQFSIQLKELKMKDLQCKITVESPEHEQVICIAQDRNAELIITAPQLWWPNGFGEQPLYHVIVELLDGTDVLDKWSRRIGLREMKMVREQDEYGESFAHQVNGVTFFAMGADYIPEDNILSRVNRKRTFELLEQCKMANYNIIRVWGGGYYPSDDFYDACDELGLVVWQDFMFACAVYELTEEFEENIKAEFIDNIKRIRHHASLGLWCGNNEMEMFVESNEYTNEPKLKSDYLKMYEFILPRILKEYDPQTFYWPASPSSGGSFDEPNAENRGDVHYWDVWHGNKPFTEYRKFFFRYVSEFGFQSFPSVKTIETFTEPQERNIFSYVMEKHQRNQSANGKILNYLGQTFLYPADFDNLVYASQLLQAEAMRYGVEHFRRNRGRCMGAVVWQLNDCWPVASWSSIDYFGRWKALHYYEKRFFAPVLVSCEEEGILTQDTNVNAQPGSVQKSIRLNVSNESRQSREVLVKWARRNAKAEILEEGQHQISVPALTAVWLDKVDMENADLYGDYVSYEMQENGQVMGSGTALFCAPKHFRFENPQLEVRVEGDEIVVTAKTFAKSVEIQNESDDLILSDNFFDMNAGTRRVKVIKGNAEHSLKVRSVYGIR